MILSEVLFNIIYIMENPTASVGSEGHCISHDANTYKDMTPAPENFLSVPN